MRRGVERREDPSPQCPKYWPRTTALLTETVKEGGGVKNIKILATLKCISTPLRDRGGQRWC